MKIEHSYNKIAQAYDQHADRFHLLTRSRNCALKSLLTQVDQAPKRILDLGVGSGMFLAQVYEQFPNSHFFGVDIAKNMLNIAKKRIPTLETVQCAIHEINTQKIQGPFDWVIAHFVLAYVDLDTLLEKIQPLLLNTSLISIVTTTHESFPVLQEKNRQYIANHHAFSRLLKKIEQDALKKTQVPMDAAAIKASAAAHNLTVVHQESIRTPITFSNPKEASQFAINGGWLLNALDYQGLPNWMTQWLVHCYFNQISHFPLYDFHVIECVLLRHQIGGLVNNSFKPN